jgi:NAD(P)-dependent dehydrogenase (short-subunit alcohol dehydrogenase family)
MTETQNTNRTAPSAKAWIITGPTSGIGRRTALELAKHGTIVLVGCDPGRLGEVEAAIRAESGGHAVPVVCDFSDVSSVAG